MKKVFLPIPELFSIYAMQFFRTVLIVGLNLSIARFLISSELFGDFRVAVKFMLILGTVLFMLYPLLERAIRGFSSSQRGLIYSAVILGITGLLNGAYIIIRSVAIVNCFFSASSVTQISSSGLNSCLLNNSASK